MGRQAKLKALRSANKAAARIERDARTRAQQYDRSPRTGLIPLALPPCGEAAVDTWARAMLPQWVPQGWGLFTVGADGWCFIGPPPVHLKLICSGEAHPDGRKWLHCSLTAPDRVPTWAEQVAVKELFCGRESLAVMVMPPRSEWVNNDPRCLHWWVCADGRPLPDFTLGRGTI